MTSFARRALKGKLVTGRSLEGYLGTQRARAHSHTWTLENSKHWDTQRTVRHSRHLVAWALRNLGFQELEHSGTQSTRATFFSRITIHQTFSIIAQIEAGNNTNFKTKSDKYYIFCVNTIKSPKIFTIIEPSHFINESTHWRQQTFDDEKIKNNLF